MRQPLSSSPERAGWGGSAAAHRQGRSRSARRRLAAALLAVPCLIGATACTPDGVLTERSTQAAPATLTTTGPGGTTTAPPAATTGATSPAVPRFVPQLPTGPERWIYRGGLPMRTETTGHALIEYAENIASLDRFTVGEGAPETHVGTVERAEYASPTRLPFGQDVWVSFSVNVRTGAPIRWALLAQYHDVPDRGDSVAPPPLAFELTPRGLGLEVIARGDGVPARTSPQQVKHTTVYQIPVLERKQWHHFVVHSVFQQTGEGSLQLWHNGRLVADRRMPMGYHDVVGPYLKYGTYRDPSPGTFRAYFANMELSTGASLIERVQAPKPVPVLADQD